MQKQLLQKINSLYQYINFLLSFKPSNEILDMPKYAYDKIAFACLINLQDLLEELLQEQDLPVVLDELSIDCIRQAINDLSKIEKGMIINISGLDIQTIIENANELIALGELSNQQANTNINIIAFFEKKLGINNNNSKILNEDGNIAGAEPPSELPSFSGAK